MCKTYIRTPQDVYARIIGDKSTLDPPICPTISPQPKVRGQGQPPKPAGYIPWSAHGVQRFWLAIRTHIWSSLGFSPAPSSTLVSLFRICCSGIRILVVGSRIRRCNEAFVFDTSCRVSGSCVGDGCLANASPSHPLRICSDPWVCGE